MIDVMVGWTGAWGPCVQPRACSPELKVRGTEMIDVMAGGPRAWPPN